MPHAPPLPPSEPAVVTIFTPLNIFLFSLVIYIVHLRFRPSVIPPAPRPAPIVYRKYTPQTLLAYDGRTKPQVYLSISRKVFDVTAGRGFYGPGGTYEAFAGRDASRGLAKNSFELDMLTDPHAEIDQLHDLNEEEKSSLRSWQEHFTNKYLIVGELVENGEAGEEDEKENGEAGVKGADR